MTTYGILWIITFFVYSTSAFVYLKYTGEDDPVDLFLALLGCLIASVLWIITIPAILIIGLAWLTSRSILKLLK